ncbi:MAG TPA: flagellinolysin, partial [Chloroflexota bacterium]|nr:flagellinolysin [Chloroflexota bacterium]
MTLSIQTNLAALTAGRNLGAAGASFGQAVRRLSSGLRINTAADDAAGDFMAAKLRAQVRGMQQASRNAQDGLSFLQTAEGGLSQMQDAVSRMRELAVQAANGVYSAAERQMLQDEVDVLAEEITRIAQSTAFNGFKPLDTTSPDATPEQEMVEALRRSWLPSSERLIEKYYGLTADGAQLEIFLDQPGTAGGAAAFVSGTAAADGRMENLELHLDYADMSDFSLPNGDGNGQTIAHEMVHAVMDRTVNMVALPTWFKEGTAEYIPGADNRLNVETAGQTTTAALIGGTWDSAWSSSSADYAAAYAAVKYLDNKLTQAGQSMISFFNTLEDTANDLDDAFAATGLYANAAAFLTEFKGGAGTTFIN